jgi:hypothetical protein
MLDVIIRKPTINAARAFIGKLKPAVNAYINEDSPLPSVSEIKRFAQIVSVINGLEPAMEKLTSEELKAKTAQFKDRIDVMIREEKAGVIAPMNCTVRRRILMSVRMRKMRSSALNRIC